MSAHFEMAGHAVGGPAPVYVVAEAGINHNGDLALALQLIDAAYQAGANMVKFQKRTPVLCVPAAEQGIMRDTPWGVMSYLEYRERVELSEDDYAQIDAHCKQRGIAWTASVWDVPSVEFLEQFAVPCHKVPSALVTHRPLLERLRQIGKPVLLSTGMSTASQIDHAVHCLWEGWPEGQAQLGLLHCTSTYPCPPVEQNLWMVRTLGTIYGHGAVIGYSGHEPGLQTTVAAVALGARIVERHLTLDRTMWGTDHAASLEPHGLRTLIRDIRVVEQALGDGVKRVYESEQPSLKKLRYREDW